MRMLVLSVVMYWCKGAVLWSHTYALSSPVFGARRCRPGEFGDLQCGAGGGGVGRPGEVCGLSTTRLRNPPSRDGRFSSEPRFMLLSGRPVVESASVSTKGCPRLSNPRIFCPKFRR